MLRVAVGQWSAIAVILAKTAIASPIVVLSPQRPISTVKASINSIIRSQLSPFPPLCRHKKG
ncbi:hypothetical protein [Oscillatoria sp. FACHB-1406]|uniref:hypothetical protein n=1 Tax=Oscillatoria sp. FACHB-1406 TaxID=2692846 RepID=UPI0016865C0F|nr:hypothetical protein [Oscillatoria sp. FACHB-1406]MBD2578426.1 hypothetical protein [Oscillatoria sp. FACHB-1406]